MSLVINKCEPEIPHFMLFVLLGFIVMFIVQCHNFYNFVPDMDRLIGIDYGRKRVGLAVSDPLGIFASALETVQTAKIIEYLRNYSEKENVSAFVVGMPQNMNGAPSEAAKDVKAFLVQLEKAFPGVPIHLEDERFTSVLAHRAMIDGGMKASDRRDKESVDKISAAIILQSYMDRTSGSNFAYDPALVPDTMTSKVSGRIRRK